MIRNQLDRMAVSYLPVPRRIFGSVVNAFNIHKSISRVINRNTSAAFLASTVKDSGEGDVKLGICP